MEMNFVHNLLYNPHKKTKQMILIAIQAISRKAKAQINQSIKEGSFK